MKANVTSPVGTMDRMGGLTQLSSRAMNLFRILCIAAVGPFVNPACSPAAEEPAKPEILSRKIKDAVLVGLPGYDGHIVQASVGKSSPVAERDPDLLILPVVKVSTPNNRLRLDPAAIYSNPTAAPLVAGIGITEFRGKKFTILIPRIFYIPVGFKIKW